MEKKTIDGEEEYKNEIRRVKEPFLTKTSGIINKKEEPVHELNEYILILMKNNGHSDIIEGVKAGEFYIKSKDGKEEKSIILTPNKLTTINYNKQYFKGWIAHEDNAIPYPQEPLHLGEMMRKIIQKIAMNYRDANEAKYMEAKTKMILYIIIGAAIGLYVLYIVGKGAGWFGGGDDVEITRTTIETIRNTTGVIAG